jgi:hypothetical protein
VLLLRVRDECVLDPVEALVERGHRGEEAVAEGVGDPVEHGDRVLLRRAGLVGPVEVFEGGRVVAAHRDEEAVGYVAVHLDEQVLVRDMPVEDDEGEGVVGLELGPLAEVERVLDGERVQVQHVAEQLQVLLARPLDVEPEEALPKLPFERGAVERAQAGTRAVDDPELHSRRILPSR